MLRASELFNRPIINSRNQVTSYTVGEVVFSRTDLKVLALYLNTKKRSRHKSFLLLKSIKAVSETGVVIERVDEIDRLEELPHIADVYYDFKTIIGFEVYNISGDLLGVVKDYHFDLITGEILYFVISEGFFTDIATGYSLLPSYNSVDFEKNIIVIDEGVKNQFVNTNAGLKKLLGIEADNWQKLS